MSRSIGLDDNVVAYLRDHNGPEHPVLAKCRHAAEAAGRTMQISAEQGAFMAFLVRLIDARRAIEVGVFTGYSSIAVALAMQAQHADARLTALDVSKEYTDVARAYWREAGLERVVDLKLGDAGASLDALLAAGEANAYDFAFIDADKTNYPRYYEGCLALLRPGGLMMFDNMLWNGSVANPADDRPDTKALREVAAFADTDKRVERTLIAAGDGLLLCTKK
jgi:caffeoyl-CoA O-methyltransferase